MSVNPIERKLKNISDIGRIFTEYRPSLRTLIEGEEVISVVNGIMTMHRKQNGRLHKVNYSSDGRLILDEKLVDLKHNVKIGNDLNISGNVGIGEIAPDGNLHISSLNDATFILEADTENDTGTEAYNPKIELRQDGNAVNSFLGIAGADGSLYTGSIRNSLYLESKNNNPAITNIQFVTGGDLDADIIGSVRMTVTATGNIGIDTNSPEGKLSITSGWHFIAVEQDIRYAHSGDNTAIVELSDVKIPGKAIITKVVAVVKTLSNLSTHEVNIQMSTDSGVSADATDSFTELLGAGVTNTDSTDSTSASDISMGTSASDAKDVWICRDVVRNGTSDQYVYVCNAGTGNGTTNSSAGTLVIIIEYYGMD
jgi:hypothetical protein